MDPSERNENEAEERGRKLGSAWGREGRERKEGRTLSRLDAEHDVLVGEDAGDGVDCSTKSEKRG